MSCFSCYVINIILKMLQGQPLYILLRYLYITNKYHYEISTVKILSTSVFNSWGNDGISIGYA